MLVFRLMLRNLFSRPVLTMVTVALIGVAVALVVSILVLSRAMEDGLVRAARPFDLLVGAKGSQTQLIMSTVLLQDAPPGNIPWDYFEALRSDPRVKQGVPLAFGDNAYGTPIVGVGSAFFELGDPKTNEPYFALAQGRVFSWEEVEEREWEAIAGSQAALTFGLGDTFQSQHGAVGQVLGGTHKEHFTLVGILKASDTPMDRAIFVPIGNYWEAHGKDTRAELQITAAMIRPRDITGFYQLHREINRDSVAQAVLAGQGMAQLFDLLDRGKEVLTLVSYLAMAMGAANVFLASYAVGAWRRRETAILRALGAGRWSVFATGLFEALATALMGALLGTGAGHLAAWVIAWQMRNASAIPIQPTFVPSEVLVGGAMLLLAAAAGLLPAIQSYQQDVATTLTSL